MSTVIVSCENRYSESATAMISCLHALGLTVQAWDNASQPALSKARLELVHSDMLVLMGNTNDIDPESYGQRARSVTTIEKPARAAFENALLIDALVAGLPVLGICGGMQRINTLLGGSLHQDMAEAMGHKATQRVCSTQEQITICQDSLLGSLSGNTEMCVLEHHHQAVDRIAGGFYASACSADGFVEAIEPLACGQFSQQMILGVQFHPELCSNSRGIIGAFTTEVLAAS